MEIFQILLGVYTQAVESVGTGVAGQKQAIKWEMKHESNKWNNQREASGLAGSG